MPAEEMPSIATFGEGTLKLATENNIHVKANAPTPQAPSLAKAVDILISNIREGREVSDVEFVDNAQKEEFLRNQQHKLAKKSRARKK
jgi:uroporphyrinogen-III synthase